MPLFVAVNRLIESAKVGTWPVLLWYIVGFFIPMYFAIFDREYARKHGGRFHMLASKESFRDFYIPGWKRMLVWFASVVISMPIICGVCKLLGWPSLCDAPR